MNSFREKLKYFCWALASAAGPRRSPCSCGTVPVLLKRKALVTSLWQCSECGLRFRVPLSDAEEASHFYQTDYSYGFTTDCPDQNQLKQMIASSFRKTEKDYSVYLDVLRALGLKPGAKIFDYGCSWGYGSWQLAKAGFNVSSHDISAPRLRYAHEKLGCQVVPDVVAYGGPVDCFFSAHVIEHLTNPEIFWRAANRLVKTNSWVVCFTPNGEPHREQIMGSSAYHQLWGRVHPLLWTAKAFQHQCRLYGFEGWLFSSPYDREAIHHLKEDPLAGDELLLIARKK